MQIIEMKLCDMERKIIFIGRVAENQHITVRVDCSDIFNAYPEAVPSAVAGSPNGDLYPVIVTKNGECVDWIVYDSDLINEGKGKYQLTFTNNEEIIKTAICQTCILNSLVPSGEAPKPINDFLTRASEILNEIPGAIDAEFSEITAEAETLPAGSSASAVFDTVTKKLTLGIPQGDKGEPGDAPIDDTAGVGDTTKVWSANKSAEVTTALNNEINQLEGDIAPVEESATATTAHGVGELFFLNGSLLVALSAIAIGDTITTTGGAPNAAVTTLSAKLIKDIQVNGTSVVTSGLANVPVAEIASGAIASNLGVVKVRKGYDGLTLNSSGTDPGRLSLCPTSEAQIKSGNDAYLAVTTSRQHAASFYGLAKAAGADMASSPNAVGTYTDAAKVAIQKMLGIYQAPWELIREDTVTNATEADIDITVDGNGQAFELTDIRILYWTPQQETAAGKADYGKVLYYYGSASYDATYNNAWSQAAGATGYVAFGEITQENGMIIKGFTNRQSIISNMPIQMSGYVSGSSPVAMELGNRTYNRISITKVTGEMKYKLYGRRKWTT